jgi:tRNA (guanosine-2'-O-)-methyltransferase
MKQLRETDLKRLHRSWRRQNEFRLALLLENVQSPFNVGGIVRTAAAMGAERLYLTGSTPAIRSPGVQKAAMRTDRFLDSAEYPTATEAVDAARADGFHVIALELADDAVPLPSADLARNICLVVGNEDHGVSPACLAACDAVAYVPQLGRVGSLNVSSAAAVGCYEVRRQGFAALGMPDLADPADVDGPDGD